jgi:glycosyltransferase involved in cell wall biosynthesis
MKICIISMHYQHGGVGRRIHNLSRELSKLGHEVHVITLNKKNTKIDAHDPKFPTLHVYVIPSFKVRMSPVITPALFNLLSYLKFKELNKKIGFDIVESQQCHSPLIFNSKGLAIIHANHGTAIGVKQQKKDIFNKIKWEILGAIEKFETKRADLVVAVSNFVKNEIVEYYRIDSKKIEVVYNGINPKEFFRRSKNRHKETFPVLLSVGRLNQLKGFDHVLNALNIIVDRCPKIMQIIVGEGPGEKSLKNYCTKHSLLKNVKFISQVNTEELNKLYSSCDLFIHVPTYEPFGMVVIEAMACGAPVVTSATGGVPEIVDDAGIVIPDINPSRLANTVLSLLNSEDKRRELSNNAVERAKEFEWEKIALLYNLILKKIVENKSDAYSS